MTEGENNGCMKIDGYKYQKGGKNRRENKKHRDNPPPREGKENKKALNVGIYMYMHN